MKMPFRSAAGLENPRPDIAETPRRDQRGQSLAISLFLLAVIGGLDYVTGYNYSLSAFYLFPVAIAAWNVGHRFAYVSAALSAAIPTLGNILAGEPVASVWEPFWNSAIIFVFYGVVIVLLGKLKTLNATLENRVRERTADLSAEIAIREDLERHILNIGDRERSRIGQDLHDVLCQQLMVCAMSGQVLEEKLEARGATEAGDARAFAMLIDEALEVARDIARGLSPVPFEDDGLHIALDELAAKTALHFRIDCRLAVEGPDLRLHPSRATHLYRIATESITNAIRHGRAAKIELQLSNRDGLGRLAIHDDGAGFALEKTRATPGLGLRIMRHRAAMVEGTIEFQTTPGRGTTVRCEFPNETGPAASENA